MKQIIIDGGKELKGTINISGAKNSAVALIPAAILSKGIVSIDNVPDVSDVKVLEKILIYLGAKVTRNDGLMIIDSSKITYREIPKNLSEKLRASYYFMSSMLGRFRKSVSSFPGGCSIGARPIDQTLKGYKALGAKVYEEKDKIVVKAKKLSGAEIYLDMPSVGATINTILTACLASGVTIIHNAAKEPEIVNVATFLNNMGAKIKGAGTSDITITGVKELGGCFTEVIPDRIEAGTYIIAGALMGNKLRVQNLIPEHIESFLSKLIEMGVNLEVGVDYVVVSKAKSLKPVNIKTLGYPGFATDLQQTITPLLCACKGESKIEETLYESRYKHIPYLQEMGAKIEILSNQMFKIKGPVSLKGAHVSATDLRAGACMVVAALSAKGKTVIDNAQYIMRGYENIVEKLKNVGASIESNDISE